MIKNHPADAEVSSRFGRLIVEAADRGYAITQRLLAFSRRSDLRAAPLDATELLASMREILAHTLGSGIEIQVKAEAALPLLLADKPQLRIRGEGIS
jgi:nitrogen-specific signal transduction histidine kinase